MKSKTVWIGKDKVAGAIDLLYAVNGSKMKLEDGEYFGKTHFCKKEFEKLTGIKLKPGQQKKVKLVIVE